MMSKDGYLPPGITQRMIDEAAPGYWEEDDREEERRVGEDLDRMAMMAAQLCRMGYKAAVMQTIEFIIKDCELDRFTG